MSKENKFIILLFFAMLSWGLSWPSGKILSTYISSDVAMFYRSFFTAIFLIPVMFWNKVPISFPKSSLTLLAFAGLCGSGYFFLFFTGLKIGFPGASGVIVTTLMPIISTILSVIIFRTKLSRVESVGLVLGIVSGSIMLNIKSSDDLLLAGNLLFVFAAFMWVCMTIATKQIKNMSSLGINFFVTAFMAILILPVAIFDHNFFNIFKYDIKFWLAMVGIVFSSVFGTTVYFEAIKVLGISKGASFSLLVPLNAVIFSYFLLDEIPTLHTIFGGSLAIFAIYLIVIRKPAK